MAGRKLVLAGGGTGGHVYPALAIGDELKARGHEVLYYGDPNRLEGRVVEKRGYTFRAATCQPWPRRGILPRVVFALSLFAATIRSVSLLRRDGAELVLGVGGYISAPTVIAAWILRIPRVIHEANVAPGLANRLCARLADVVLLTYAETGPRLPGKAPRELVGCPVTPGVLSGEPDAARSRYGMDPKRPVLLVVGGSLGAATLNDLAVAMARDPDRTYQVLHITGPAYYEEVKERLVPFPKDVVLVDYEHRMADAYAAADLVLCRAGSSTLAELTALGKPSVLIPSPNVTNNHQEANALGLETAGAAIMFTEAGLQVTQVLDRLRRLMRDRVALGVMAGAAASLGRRETAGNVADLLMDLLDRRS